MAKYEPKDLKTYLEDLNANNYPPRLSKQGIRYLFKQLGGRIVFPGINQELNRHIQYVTLYIHDRYVAFVSIFGEADMVMRAVVYAAEALDTFSVDMDSPLACMRDIARSTARYM